MNLSDQIREEAEKSGKFLGYYDILAHTLEDNLPTILAALSLQELMESPGCVEEVARQLYCAQEDIQLAENEAHVAFWFDADECAKEGYDSIRPEYERMAQAAISAMKGTKP